MRELYEKTNTKFGPWGCRYLTDAFFEGLPAAFRRHLAFAAAYRRGRREPIALAMAHHRCRNKAEAKAYLTLALERDPDYEPAKRLIAHLSD